MLTILLFIRNLVVIYSSLLLKLFYSNIIRVEAKIFGLLDFINSDKIKLELFSGNFDNHSIVFSL